MPPVPLIHQTDLFRPHNDPDDHFDLACAFAMAASGRARLLGVLCDYPPPGQNGDPDIAAVSMLNRLTGISAPVVVGSSRRPVSRHDTLADAGRSDLEGLGWLLETMHGSPEPAVITVVGSCRDVALAARREPDLFARKCRGIYLNAGTGTPDPRSDDQLEYNVGLDPASYASMFDIPCPVYWMPCFERLAPGVGFSVMSHGTYYSFVMSELLPKVPAPLQRYFLSMLDQEPGTRWLRSLSEPVDPEKLASWGRQVRNMWSTASFFHLVGVAVAKDGTTGPLNHSQDQGVYRFVPVQVTCDDDGRTHWRPGKTHPARYKFEVTDTAAYAAAMTRAMTGCLSTLLSAAAS